MIRTDYRYYIAGNVIFEISFVIHLLYKYYNSNILYYYLNIGVFNEILFLYRY